MKDKIAKRIEKAEKIINLAWNFIIDARGSWETGEGNICLDLIKKYRQNYKGVEK